MSGLIERKDAIDAIVRKTIYDNVDQIKYECSINYAKNNDWLGGLKEALEAIEEIPSAEPERKKGKWMEKETFDNADYEIPVWQSARCSVCGKYMTAPYGYYFKVFPYCPNCGSYNGDDNEK